ncbi:MAG TPA: hypothetical protein VFE24_03165 [Pirellulales bacterium]|jgi:hypothetical protein|nr:hypothetical protein [Pirellulales bacterium]
MLRLAKWILVAAVALFLCADGLALAQSRPTRPTRKPAPDKTEEAPAVAEPPTALVTDPKFKQVYLDFITKAERLGEEFDKAKQYDKAKACYEEINRLVPEYAKAKQMIEVYNQRESTADKKSIEIQANKDWQDTGVVIVPGKPVHITAKGTWTFTLSNEISADGIEIPKELRDYPLGALIGIIQTPDPKDMKPFVVGSAKSLMPEKGGKLLLRMYHNHPADNKGKLTVDIQGTFEKGK